MILTPSATLLRLHGPKKQRGFDVLDSVAIACHSKLANYRGAGLDDSWGGDYAEHGDIEKVQAGQSEFVTWYRGQYESPGPGMKTVFASGPRAGPGRSKVIQVPMSVRHWGELPGDPNEMYLSCRGTLVRIRTAALALGVPTGTLEAMKARWVIDSVVWDKTLKLINLKLFGATQ